MSKNGLRAYWSRVIEPVKQVVVIFNASAVTFNLFICAIPFTLILISIIGYVLSIDTAYTELVRYGTELLPDITYEQTNSVTLESERIVQALLAPLIQGRNVLGITGIIIMLFFTQSLFHSLKLVLFNIFDIQKRFHPLSSRYGQGQPALSGRGLGWARIIFLLSLNYLHFTYRVRLEVTYKLLVGSV